MQGEQVLAVRGSRPGLHHSESLLPLLDEVLRELALDLARVDAFAISIGPGAFTSLRIGLATLKGLAFGSDQPVVPVSTLEALAETALRSERCEQPPQVIAAALDARRDELYAAAYRTGHHELRPVLVEGVYTSAQLLQHLPAGSMLVGDGTALFAELAKPLAEAGVWMEGQPCTVPDAAAVGTLGQRGLAAGRGLRAADLVPRYLRRAEAEVARTAQRFE